MNLLTVDWDFFVPIPDGGPDWELYDWGHNESWGEALQEKLWEIRAEVFHRFEKPLPDTSGDEVDFWSRFVFSPEAKLFISDSHGYAADPRVAQGIRSVLLFDAHHDAGYDRAAASPYAVQIRGQVDCANWMVAYKLFGARLRMRYPTWRTRAFEVEPEPMIKLERKFDSGGRFRQRIDRVHVARSGAWTPSWLDSEFFTLIQSCPVRETIMLEDLAPRNWVLQVEVQS